MQVKVEYTKQPPERLVLAHGWALDDRFWGPLGDRFDLPIAYSSRPYFFERSKSFSNDWKGDDVRPWLGIGHSLGFRRLAEGDLTGCQGLVSLSGFFDFCRPCGTKPRILSRMARNFQQNPAVVLERFYQQAELEWSPALPLNADLLLADLQSLLNHENDEMGRPRSAVGGVPIFALAGSQDQIVPEAQSRSQFAQLALHSNAGHSLGFEYSDWCEQQIKRFFDIP